MTIDMYFHDKQKKEMLMVNHNGVCSSHYGDIAAHLEEYVASRDVIPEDIARGLLGKLNTNFMSRYAENKALGKYLKGEKDIPVVDKDSAAKTMRHAIAKKAGITYSHADLPEDVPYVSTWKTEEKPKQTFFGKRL